MKQRLPVYLLVTSIGFGCASWDLTRQRVVDPINQLLHIDYPAALEQRDVAAYASLHVPKSVDHAEREAKRLFADWQDVSHAHCIIREIDLIDEDNLTASVSLRLDGIEFQGTRRTVLETLKVNCSRMSDGWKIVGSSCTSTEQIEANGPTFVDEATSRGLDFVQHSHGVKDQSGVLRPYLPGSGMALADITGDGLDDVAMVGGRQLRLFVNRSGKFLNESAARGVMPLTEGEGRYTLFGDIDNDGDRDLFVGVLDGRNVFYENDGHGQFTHVWADELGITSSGETTGASFADFDGDGDLDLFIANGANLLRIQPEPIYNADNATANQLFLNKGDGTFIDATARSGVGDTGWALACTTCDYDQDGDVDLYVANDFGQDRLYRNSGNATFEEVAESVGIAHRGSSMGAAFGDSDGDGDIDIFVAGMSSNSAWILDQPGYPVPAPWPISFIFRGFVLDIMKEMFHGNRFYQNRGDGTFAEVSELTGTARSGWAWGGIFLDYDNDSRLDLYVLNGLISGELEEDC